MAMVQQADMAVKANEILARFRPIAPKPALAGASPAHAADGVVAANRVLYQLQSRPCRARKRSRPTVVPVSPMSAAQPAAKRKRAAATYTPLRCAAATEAVDTATRAHVSFVVPGSACLPVASLPPASVGDEDLARLSPKAAAEAERDVPVERDLLRKLLEPKVISPRALRPVGSIIHVESIHRTDSTCTAVASKTAAEVEDELEADALPAAVSDSSNRVRLVNDAYKEMVGQPECPWLDAVAAASKRISGEVVLVVAEPVSLPKTYGVFTYTAKIEWEYDGKCTSISAPCDVSRLQCDSRDYLFTWRFRTADAGPTVSHRSGEMSES
ncbi:uncharacterized protein LOC133890848 [Phragmites australis]|uniref:uncharacterized protein LOC133890848 n=1 Tax=Phragmites australis TaxID=29695 RepID=UPI002D7724E1|nr:uncharacterized protein LOC133890848 [Phragmites australis]